MLPGQHRPPHTTCWTLLLLAGPPASKLPPCWRTSPLPSLSTSISSASTSFLLTCRPRRRNAEIVGWAGAGSDQQAGQEEEGRRTGSCGWGGSGSARISSIHVLTASRPLLAGIKLLSVYGACWKECPMCSSHDTSHASCSLSWPLIVTLFPLTTAISIHHLRVLFSGVGEISWCNGCGALWLHRLELRALHPLCPAP